MDRIIHLFQEVTKDMRIWYQSSLSLGVDPVWKPYQESLKRHVQEVARQDTQVDVHGVEFVEPQQARSAYIRYLNKGQVINNAIRAEREGYDAFCVGCTLDPGFPEVKEVVDIPVAFLFESCLHLACILAGRFSLIAFNKDVLLYSIQEIKQYGLYQWFVPCDTFNLDATDLPGGFENPEPIVEAVNQATKRAIEHGAGILLATCNILNQVLVDGGIRQVGGVPILDTIGAIVKVTELMVDLKKIGVSRSSKGLFTSLSKDELARIRKAYGLE